MSNDDQYIQEMLSRGPDSRPEDFDFFAICVNNEVAYVMPATKTAEGFCAAMASNPIIIKLTDEEKTIVKSGMGLFNINPNDETPRFGFSD